MRLLKTAILGLLGATCSLSFEVDNHLTVDNEVDNQLTVDNKFFENKLVIIGTGYVGAITGSCFADLGIKTTLVDIDFTRIESLKSVMNNVVQNGDANETKSGEMPFYEPGLKELLQKNKDRISFTSKIEEAIIGSNIAMIAVGTPPNKKGEADLKYVFDATRDIAKNIKHYTVIVVKSTVPPGTCNKVAMEVLKIRPEFKEGENFDVASNPEFLREGEAIKNFFHPHCLLIGTNSKKCEQVMRNLYKPILDSGVNSIFTNLNSSELSKYATNSYGAIKVSFINQLADLSEKFEADVDVISELFSYDNRLQRLHPGPGYGGSCFPKDAMALSKAADKVEYDLSLVKAADNYNRNRKIDMSSRIINSFKYIKDPIVAILGVTFKANTDDLRESVSLDVIPQLINSGFKVKIYDPCYNSVTFNTKSDGIFGSILKDWMKQGAYFAHNIDDCVTGSDGIAILTEWEEFKTIDLKNIKDKLNNYPTTDKLNNHPTNKLTDKSNHRPPLIDLRNIFIDRNVEDFSYRAIGKM